jgi:hypothetical protein
MPVLLSIKIFRQPAPDLVEDQTYQRLGPADVGWRHDQIQRGRLSAFDKIPDLPITPSRDLRDDGIAIQPEERHCRRQHAGALVFTLVQELARRRRDDRMWPGIAKMRGRHHRVQGGFDRTLWIRQEIRHANEGLVFLSVEHVEDSAHQQRMACFLPVIALFQGSFGIDEHVRDVLNVAHLPLSTTNLHQRIIGSRLSIGWIEQQDAAMEGAEARGEIPVLAFDVVNDATTRPGQKGRNDKANALARTGWCKTEHMLRSVMAQVLAP